MFAAKQGDSPIYDHPSKTFIGVRFVLHGFDPINSQKVRSKLVNGGGVDARQYGPSCTHVIVDKLVYDDPICVLARRDGKVLVTGLWVDHSFDIGMPADPTSVMYRPLRDLDGIPGAKSLIVCLTGYQRQDRDDIMIMVGLMGASFSKPLVANKVTHLICYKFEGEKFELAKKMKRIKLVNHRWLEDCLKAWEILPEANYDKSGYELETMEAEAKDSEEEEEEAQEIGKKQNGERKINLSPHNLHVGMIRTDPSPQSKNISMNLVANCASTGLPNAHNKNDAVLATAEKDKSFPALNLQGTSKKQPDVLSSRDSSALGNVTCGETSELALESHDRIIAPVKVGNDLGFTSGSGERSPHSDSDMPSTVNYLKNAPRRNTLTMSSGGMGSNLSILSKVLIDKVNVPEGFDISLSGVEKAKVGTDTGSAKTPAKEARLINEEGKRGIFIEKRKMDVSYDSSKLQKTSHSPKPCDSESPLFFSRTGASEHTILINDASDMSATLGIGHNSPINAAMTSFSSYDRKSLKKSVLNSSVSENKQEVNLVAPQTSSIGFKSMNLGSEHGIKNVFNKAENPIGEVGKPQEEMQNVHAPSPQIKGLETDKSNSPSMDLFKGINTASVSKPVRRKVIAKKSLGCKPNVGPGSATSHRGPIFLNETAFRSDAATCLSSGQETTSRRMTVEPENAKNIPPTANDNGGVLVETQNLEKLGDEVVNKMASMDDETENPEDKEENEFDGAGGEEKLKEVNTTNEMNMATKDKSEYSQLTTRQANANSLRPHNDTEISNGDENGAEVEKEASGREDVLAESTCEGGGKLAKQKKFKVGKTLRKPTPYITKRKKSKQVLGEESNNKNVPNDQEKYPNGKIKRTKLLSKSKDSMEIGKENRPADIGDKNVNLGEQQVGKVAVKSGRTPIKVDPKACMSDQDSIPEERVLKMKAEPAWFILSGHKLQRKEFQRVIRHLKGRLCRDSHQWSYQATHFVVPDPIRRTEKFFAAAASGRWILKTDYLTESNQAGGFLREEPFEWHKNGLSEDGAINLEAPRKWRLLRERTGHGAFYGMRIVIYGECIAPPLDTLKRVIKAGDGTILATSPPYSRFFNSGVDFAIVSPGMPRVDMWVQEFLGHEVPCVTADYLVEYVCKPGFSLERHVQYNTHAWAEKSFANLQARLHEVVELQTTCKGNVDDDLQCQVCGSADRGEVMLICGDEGGSTGCGVGVHIDCCNPPLEQVPDEDWFCPKCSETRNGVNCRKKGISKGK